MADSFSLRYFPRLYVQSYGFILSHNSLFYMVQQIDRLPFWLKYFLLWLIVMALIVYLGFVTHDTIVLFGLWAVKNPAIFLPGWHTKTTNGFSRFVWFVIGIVWMVGMTWYSESLRDWVGYKRWKRPFLLTLLWLLALYACNGLVSLVLVLTMAE